MSSSPFTKSKEKKKPDFLPTLKAMPLEKFKAEKSILSRASAKALVEKTCSETELRWLERWLDTYVRSHSLPPQCAKKDAFDALTAILPPSQMLQLLDTLRAEFAAHHPPVVEKKDELDFLLNALSSEGMIK